MHRSNEHLQCIVAMNASSAQKVPEVEENIEIAVILINVDMADVITLASQGNILCFKENNRLYYELQLKAVNSCCLGRFG